MCDLVCRDPSYYSAPMSYAPNESDAASYTDGANMSVAPPQEELNYTPAEVETNYTPVDVNSSSPANYSAGSAYSEYSLDLPEETPISSGSYDVSYSGVGVVESTDEYTGYYDTGDMVCEVEEHNMSYAPPEVEIPSEPVEETPSEPETPPLDVESMGTAEKIGESLTRVVDHLPESLKAKVSSFLTPENAAILGGTLAVYAGSHFFGVGEVVDVALLAVGAVAIGSEILSVGSDLYDFADKAAGAKTEAELDESAQYLARALSTVLVDTVAIVATRKAVGSSGGFRPGPPSAIAFETPIFTGNGTMALATATVPSIAYTGAVAAPWAAGGMCVASNIDDNVMMMSSHGGGGGSRTSRTSSGGGSGAGREVNPQTGREINPRTGRDINPKTGRDIDAASGRDISPRTGQPTGAQQVEALSNHGNAQSARARVTEEIGHLGDDAVSSEVRMFSETPQELKGLTNGARSADGKRGWRLDYDPDKGIHFNWFDWTTGKKGAGGRWGAESFPGTQDDFINMLLEIEKYM